MDSFPSGDGTGIGDKIRAATMERIRKSDPSTPREAAEERDGKKRESGGSEPRDKADEKGSEAADHFESLKKSADLINKDLEKKNSRHRFYIYRESDDIFINLVRLDGDGGIVEVIRKNITHQEFSELIKRLENGEGLIIDSSG